MATTDEASAEESPPDDERCIALTTDGDRCTRRATDGKFCYQHDESDPTVEDAADESGGQSSDAAEDARATADGGTAAESSGEESGDDSESEASEESDSAEESTEESDEEAEESTDETEESSGDDGAASGASDVLEVREAVIEVSSDLIGRPLDGVVEVGRTDDGWLAVVEVIERRSVPDTQDILGRYELSLEGPENVTGYRRTAKYRRSDTDFDAM